MSVFKMPLVIEGEHRTLYLPPLNIEPPVPYKTIATRPYQLISVNLNSPATQLQDLLSEFPDCAIFCINELDDDPAYYDNGIRLTPNHTAYHHPPVTIEVKGREYERIYSAIVINHNIINKVKHILMAPPFTMIYIKDEMLHLNVCTFYRPNANSVKLAALGMNNKSDFNFIVNEVIQKQAKVSSFFGGDLNAVIEGDKRSFESGFVKEFGKITQAYTDLIQGKATFFRKNAKKNNSIDAFLVKGLDVKEFEMHPGSMIKNDGHRILHVTLEQSFECDGIPFNHFHRAELSGWQIYMYSKIILPYLSKALFDTTVKSRVWFNDDISNSVRILRTDNNLLLHKTSINRSNYSLPDNESYSGVLANILDKAFNFLTPETLRTVTPRKFDSMLSYESHRLRMLFCALWKHHGQVSDDDAAAMIYKAIRELKPKLNKSLKNDRRSGITKVKEGNDLTENALFQINKRLHPKVRKNANTEIFTAGEYGCYFEKLQWRGAKEKILQAGGIDLYKKYKVPVPLHKFRFEGRLPLWFGSGKADSVKRCILNLQLHTRGLNSPINKRIMSFMVDDYHKFFYESTVSDIILGIYPEEMRTNKLRPIQKKANGKGIENHRFISVPDPKCSQTGKLVSAVVNIHLEENNVYFKGQHGFRRYRGTHTALAEIFFDIVNRPPASKAIMLCLDAINAFGSPPVIIILKVLRHLIHDNSLVYFEQLLKQRVGVVVHAGEKSSPVALPLLGVPQGEPVSPFLFNLVIDGLKVFCEDESVRLTLFADDLTLVLVSRPGETDDQMVERARDVVHNFSQYLGDAGIFYNYDKCIFMAFGKDWHRDIFLTRDGNIIKKVTKFTLLGFNLNSDLTFKDHFNFLLRKMLDHRQKVRNLIDLDSRERLLRLAYSLVFGNINYVLSVTPRLQRPQYNQMQTAINSILYDILKVHPTKRRDYSGAELLNKVRWLSYYNNHDRLQMKYLNNILCTKNTEKLYEIVKSSLFYSNGDKYKDSNDNMNTFDQNNPNYYDDIRAQGGRVPVFRLNIYPFITASLIKNTFPFCAFLIFNEELPDYIKEIFGTTQFNQAIDLFYHCKCQHRLGSSLRDDCTRCQLRHVLTDGRSMQQTLIKFKSILHVIKNNDRDIDFLLDEKVDFKNINLEQVAWEHIESEKLVLQGKRSSNGKMYSSNL